MPFHEPEPSALELSLGARLAAGAGFGVVFAPDPERAHPGWSGAGPAREAPGVAPGEAPREPGPAGGHPDAARDPARPGPGPADAAADASEPNVQSEPESLPELRRLRAGDI